jgi:hypothetical protein
MAGVGYDRAELAEHIVADLERRGAPDEGYVAAVLEGFDLANDEGEME